MPECLTFRIAVIKLLSWDYCKANIVVLCIFIISYIYVLMLHKEHREKNEKYNKMSIYNTYTHTIYVQGAHRSVWIFFLDMITSEIASPYKFVKFCLMNEKLHYFLVFCIKIIKYILLDSSKILRTPCTHRENVFGLSQQQQHIYYIFYVKRLVFWHICILYIFKLNCTTQGSTLTKYSTLSNQENL